MTNKYFKKVKEDKLNYKNTVVNQIFSSVSKKYDLMNDLMSFGFHTSWKNKVAEILDVDKKKIILDLASGSGDITYILKENYNCKCISYDSNLDMLKIAKKKLKSFKPILINGQAESLPFKNQFFDGVVVSFGLRNFDNISASLKECKRVLKKKGKFICLEFSEVNNPTLRKFINIYYKIIPKYGSIITKNKLAYTYLIESIKRFPNQIELTKKIEEVGLKNVKVIDILGGVAAIHICEKL